MKRLPSGMLALVGLMLVPALASAGGNANFVLGGRGLSSDFWEPNEGQGSFGVNLDFGKETWPVQIAFGVHGSYATSEADRDFGHRFDLDRPELVDLSKFDFSDYDFDLNLFDTTVNSSVGEFSTGILWRRKGEVKIVPYVGGGITWISARKEIRSDFVTVSDDDFSPGGYINGGVFWRLGKHFNIGIDARLVAGTSIELFGEEGDANYGQLGLILGYGW